GSNWSRARFPPRNGGRAGHRAGAGAMRSKLQALGRGETLELVADRHAAYRFVQEWQDGALALAAVEVEEQRFDWADRRRRQRQRAVADNRQCQCADRLRGEFATQRHRLAVLFALVG